MIHETGRRSSQFMARALVCCLCTVLAASLLWAGPVLALDTMAAAKISDPDTLQYRLDKFGSVRVIVKLDVPNYGQLRTASQSFKVLQPGQEEAASAAVSADAALSAGIASVSATVQAKLTGGATHLRTFKYLPYAAFRVEASGLEALASLSEVLAITEDKVHPLPRPENKTEVNTPSLDESMGLIGAEGLWAVGVTGEGWYVAVLDNGIRSSHEFFNDKNIVEACFTSRDPDENPSASLCPNGEEEMIGTGAAEHYYNLEGIVEGWDHGTHVAGIAAGRRPDDALMGVAPDADIIAIQVFSDGFSSSECDGAETCAISATEDQLAGLEYVYSLRRTYAIASANMSLGGDEVSSPCDDDALKSAIDLLRGAGIVTAIASGNEYYCNAVNNPACISTSVAVGATDNSDVIAEFSNWQADMVPLFAPGVQITSATATSDSSYAAWDGTSMATPMVAGAWALLRDYSAAATLDEILAALKNTAKGVTFDRCDNPSGINRRIQVDQAASELTVAPQGQADIWWHKESTGENALWFMNGTAKLSETMLSVQSYWDLGCLADFNNDEEPDVAWHDPASGATVIQYMVDIAPAGETSSVTVPSPWRIAGCADFDRDNIMDIFWNNPDTGRNGVTYLDSDGQLDGDYGFYNEMSAEWQPRGVADFNGDDHADVVFRNPDTGEVVIVIFYNLAAQGTFTVTTIATEWDIKGVGDFNNDDYNDLLWRNETTGQNGVLFMQGLSPYGNTLIDTMDSTRGWDISGAGTFH